jgi:soluble lytic murein transglycosylase-like protein
MMRYIPPLSALFLLALSCAALGSSPEGKAADGLATPPPGKARAVDKRTLKTMIDRVAQQQGVDRHLVHAVISAESGYDPTAVSTAGAIGLMQVMPATAADYGVASSDALFDPETNVKVGTRHLKRLISKYRSVGRAVIAYNAGEGALEANRALTFPETRRYSMQVINQYRRNQGKRPLKLREVRIPARSRVKIPSVVGTLDPKAHSAPSGSRPMFSLEWEN